MKQRFKTSPADTYCGSGVVDGEILYVPTANGIMQGEVSPPEVPNIVAFEKKTGRILATDKTQIARHLLKGQWSSVSLGKVGERNLVFYGGGDGRCYAFKSLTKAPKGQVELPPVWSYDCIPAEYKQLEGASSVKNYYLGDVRRSNGLNNNDGMFVGVSEIVGTPVFHNNRIYVAIGRDAAMGRGRGALHCIDATKRGDVTVSGKIWSYQGLDRSVSTVSIAEGLVYAADVAGRLHCVDAETGHCYWIHECNCKMMLGSTLMADGKVYMPTEKGLFVLKAGKEKKLLSQISVGAPIYSTPVAANGVLYIASQNGWLWAIRRTIP